MYSIIYEISETAKIKANMIFGKILCLRLYSQCPNSKFCLTCISYSEFECSFYHVQNKWDALFEANMIFVKLICIRLYPQRTNSKFWLISLFYREVKCILLYTKLVRPLKSRLIWFWKNYPISGYIRNVQIRNFA